MAVAQGPFLAAVLLLVSSGLLCSSLPPLCPEPCTCPGASLLNCSSSGLSLVPQHIQNAVTELDLSHNLLNSITPSRPYYNLRSLWLGNSNITHLSLCIERGHYIRGRQILHRRPWGRQGCVSWAPTLQLLSVERNQLEQFPEGLQGCESLQVLQLSFNKISSLQPEDFSHLQQLTELHLQHNLITSLHPQIFQDLTQLQVLDLSYNKLTSLHPLMYLSLHNIGVAVRLDGNMWQCDCSMRSLRRRMAYDSSQGLHVWTVVCAFPSILSGRNLLQLEEDDLNCFNTENQPEVHQDVTVYSGSEILLSCSAQDSVWWTPIGEASVTQPQAGLPITDIAEKETQLYVCVSKEGKVVSVLNLQISKTGGTKRKSRSLPRIRREISPQNSTGQGTGQVPRTSQTNNLALAVCLSIFFTFLVAFILGVLARPCIDSLCKRVTRKRHSTQTLSGSTTEQRQYDNEAFNRFEEPLETGTHRERRVTFSSENTNENSNVQYYDTMASRDQNSTYTFVTKRETAKAERGAHTAGSSGSESSSLEENQRDRGNIPVHAHKQYENIPDPVNLEKRRSISSSSDSSQSNEDQMTQRGHSTPKSSMLEKDSVQQTAGPHTAGKGQLQQICLEGSEIPGFSTEPFADWSPHRKTPNLWQENNEQFEFSDSVQSMSPRSGSASGSLNDSKLTGAPAADKQKRNVTSSSSSSDSDSEPTEYTVNPDQDEEDIRRNHNEPKVTSSGLKQSDFKNNTQMHAVNLTITHSSSSHSSDTDKENTIKRETEKRQKDKSMKKSDTRKKIEPMPRTKWRLPSLGLLSQGKRLDTKTTSPAAAYSSSSSSESEAQVTNLKEKHNTGSVINGIKINKPETMSTVLDRPNIPQVKKRKAPLPPSHSISSDDSTDEETKPMQRQKQGVVSVVGSRSERSSSDSDNEKRKNVRGQEKEQIKITRPPMKVSQTTSHGPPTKHPVHGLEHTSAIKRHLNSSSSSDSEDETNHMKKHQQGKTYMPRPPNAIPKTEGLGPQTKLPAIDLDRTIGVKRRLDIKAPSFASDSSSSSDSDNEKNNIRRQEKAQIQITRPLMKNSQTTSHGPTTKQPVHGPEHTPAVKRHSDSSSSSDSEDETNHLTKEQQGKTYMPRPPTAIPKTEGLGPQTKLPAIDLDRTIGVKRRLDIKAPSPASNSSSSSDSDSEATNKMRYEKEQIQITRPSMKVSQTTSHGPPTKKPVRGLEHTSALKRYSDSSSSSDSEDETNHMKKQQQGKTYTPRPPIAIPKTEGLGPQTKLPAIDLDRTIGVKRRLDIKAPSPASNSSSSSDSDSEATNKMRYEKEQIQITRPPMKVSQTTSHGPPTKKPVRGLEHTSALKRYSDSSSSSDSEDETNHLKKEQQGKTYTPRPPIAIPKTEGLGPQTKLPAIDLDRTIGVKRRLDIKAPSPASNSSSSSDSDSEATNKMRYEKEQIQITRPSMKVSQTTSHGPPTKKPVHGLEHTSALKRYSDSSSSSDSEDETNHLKKEQQGKTYTPRPPIAIPKTEGLGPQTKLPAIDLDRTIGVKRRLDIKAPTPASNSSSSSDSDSEATNKMRYEKEQIQITRPPMKVSQTTSHGPPTKQPVHGLEHTSALKRYSDSSSSSDSEDETNHMKKQQQGKTYTPRPPIAIPKTEGLGPQTKLPAIDLDRTIGVKRRLDIKAPSPASNSSSSSDSDSEATNKMRYEKEQIQITRPPMKVSQTTSHGPPTKQPVHGLEHTSALKRYSDSSSSSDSEDETNHLKKEQQGKTYTPRPPIAIPKTEGLGPQTKLPAIDLDRTIGVKRRLDIKAPSPASDSSYSSNSENETANYIRRQEKWQTHVTRPSNSHGPPTKQPVHGLEHTSSVKRHSDSSSSSDSDNEKINNMRRQEKEQMQMVRPSMKVPQTPSQGPTTKQPIHGLGYTSSIKRHSDSSSSSDSEDETNHLKKEQQGKTYIPRPPIAIPKTEGPQTKLPAIDLDRAIGVKRRLDIKAPSPASNSSSSSDSDSEVTNKMRLEKEHIQITRPSMKVSQTTSHGPPTKKPVHGLEHTSALKRHSDSSSSSDSDNEKTNNMRRQKEEQMQMTRPPMKVPQTPSHGPSTKQPIHGLGYTSSIRTHSDSSSSSDTEDETSNRKKQQQGKTYIPKPQNVIPKAEGFGPQTKLPAIDLDRMIGIKRRLDIKAPSPASDSFSSSVNDTHLIQKQVRQPRKMDINVTSGSHSFSSSDSENEAAGHVERQRPGKLATVELAHQKSKTESQDWETQWPTVSLTHMKRRLAIKVKSPPPNAVPFGEGTNYFMQGTSENANKISSPSSPSSSSSDSDEGNQDLRNPVTSTEPKPNPRWPQLDLKRASHVNQRLDIKTQSSQRDPVLSSVSPGFQQIESSSSSSDSENENRGSRLTALSKDKQEAFITSPKTSMIYAHTPKSDNNIQLLKYTVFTDDVGERTSSISTSSEINPEFQERRAMTNLSLPRFRKRLEITPNTHTPPNMISSPPESPSSKKGSRITLNRWESERQRYTFTEKSLSSENKPDIKLSESTHATPLHQKPDSSSSSSSSEAENKSAEHTSKRWRKRQSPPITDKEASYFQSSPQAVTMKLDQSQGQTKDMKKEVRVELKSKTAKVSEETDSAQPSWSLTNVSYIRRDPDIRTPVPHDASSSSNSENKMIYRSVPYRSLGVTHIEKGQNIKVSVPRTSSSSSSSSSSSENESEVKRYPSKQHRAVSEMSEVSNNSPITYKRSIFSSSFSPTVSSTSIDNAIKKQIEQSKQVGNADLSTEMQWTGTSRQLSVSSLRKHQDIGSSTSLQAPPKKPEMLLFDNPNSPNGNIADKIKQGRWKTDGILMPEYATFNANSVSPQPSTTLNELAKSPSSRERKGLSALKAMSVERQQWDTQAEQFGKDASPVYDVSRVDYSFNNQRSLGGIKPLTNQPLAQFHSSSSSRDEISVDAFTYAIPQYRRHIVLNTDMPQDTPPPIPATPPHEPAGFTWRSPQSSMKQNMQGTRSYLQQNTNSTAQIQNGSSDTYNPNISLV